MAVVENSLVYCKLNSVNMVLISSVEEVVKVVGNLYENHKVSIMVKLLD